MKTCKKGLHQYLAGERQCPECAKISKAAYFAANYEKEHARSAARYAANPGKLQAFFKALLLADPDCKKKANALYAKNNVEKVKASREKWKAENPEKNRLASTNHYKNNKVEILARAEKYRLAHPEKAAARKKAWRAKNPDAARIQVLNRQAKRRGNGGVLSKGLSERLFGLQRGLCPCCSQPLGDNYHRDHIMPIDLGGANEDWNIQLLRAQCNLQKRNKRPEVFMRERGFLI